MADWQQVGKKGKAKRGGGRGGGSRPGDVPRPGESYRATVARRLRTDPDYDEEKCIDNVIEASITEELHNDDQSAMQKAIAESLCQLQPGGYEDDDSLLQKIMEESRLEALRKNEQMNTIAQLTGMLSEEEQEKRLLLLSRTEAMRAARAGAYPYSTPQPPSASTAPARAGPRAPEAVTAQPAIPEPDVSEDEELRRALELSILDIDAPPPPVEHDDSMLDADEVLARSIQASLEAAEEEERRAREREAKERRDLQEACAASMQAGLDDATPKHAGRGNGGPKGSSARGPQPNPPVYKSMGGVSAARGGSAPHVPPAPPQRAVPQKFGMSVDSLEDPAVLKAQEASLKDFLRQQQQRGDDCLDELEAVRDDGIKLELERKQRLAQYSPSAQRPRGPAWQREEWEDEIEVMPVQRPTLSILRGNLDNQIFRFNAEYRVEVTIVEDRLVKLRFNRSKAGARLFNPSKLDETEDVLKVVRAIVVETLQKPGVRLQERKEWGIHVFIDWSNIALSARGQGLTRNDNIRVDPARFAALVEADRDVKQRFVAGSRGMAFNEAWPIWEKLGYEKYIEDGGRESAVDMSIREKLIKILLGDFPNKRKIVLCTGDGNFRDSDGVMNQSMISFPDLVQTAVHKGFWVELWTWRHATAHAFKLMQTRGYGTRMEVKYLDDYRDFVCKAPDEELEFHDAITPGSSAKSSPDLRGGNANMRSPSKGPMICDMMPKLSLLPSAKREDPSQPSPVQSHKPSVQQPSVMGAGALYSPNDPPLSNSMAQGGARYGIGTIGASNSRMQAPIGRSMGEPMVGATGGAGGGASYMSQYNQPMASYGSRPLDPSTASFNPQRPAPLAPVVPTSTVASAEGSYVAGGSLSMIGGGQYYNPSLAYGSMPPAPTAGATPYLYQGSAPAPPPYTSFGVPATSGPQMVMMGTPGFQPGGIMGGGMLQGNGYAHPSTAAMQPPSSVQAPQPAPQRPQLYTSVDNHTTPLPTRAVPAPQPPKPPVPSISTRPTSVGSTTPSPPHVRAAMPPPTVAPVAGLQEGKGSAASLSAKADKKEAPVKTGDSGAAKVEAAGDKKVAATTPNPNRWKWEG